MVLVLLITFIFCALFIRLFVIGGIYSDNLMIKAAPQWVRSLPLSAKRGSIIDSSGCTLVHSHTLYDVYVRAKNVENPEEVTRFLSALLGLDYQSLYKKVTNKGVSEVLIKLDIDDETAHIIMDKSLKGIVLGENIGRNYNNGNFLSQVLGFITVDNVGQAGLEAYYNTFLKGVDGKVLNQSDVKGIEIEDTLKYFIEPVAGLNLQLNIDSSIQKIVEGVLGEIMTEHNPKSVSAIVMDTQGRIVSMAKTPSLDNNNLPRDDVKMLMEYTKNSMITDIYEPGSTFKILTLAAALSEGLTNVNEYFYCPGYRIVSGEKIKCWKTTGHGSQTLVEGVRNSCNCVFMDLAMRLGADKLYQYLTAFGLGSPTGVDFLGESGGIIMPKQSIQPVDLARIGFGQAVATTQLQLLSAFTAAVNGGMLYQPYFVDNIYTDAGVKVQQNMPIKKKQVISPQVSETINYLLYNVVNKGEGQDFLSGYDIGGKTGTAQKYENGKIAQGKYVSSFFGMYPTKNPQFAILLCVDEPGNGVYYGSVVASPFAKKIFEGIFEYKNICPNTATAATTSVEVPNLVGMSLSAANILLNNLGFYMELDGEGLYVKNQYPRAGTVLSRGSDVMVMT
ncbi:MAG: PASTA domain-containing protein [Christensenellaceae bacterium]|nr:PASTA domain-containing protein [Christensenellaceae bacterium]